MELMLTSKHRLCKGGKDQLLKHYIRDMKVSKLNLPPNNVISEKSRMGSFTSRIMRTTRHKFLVENYYVVYTFRKEYII